MKTGTNALHTGNRNCAYELSKRGLDVVVAITGILVLSPVFIFIALLIRLSSPGPVFYRGIRSGLYGTKFRIFKFRSMVINADRGAGTTSRGDKPGEKFDTPTLVEVWRTAPYLHDGSAATMRDVLTIRNRKDRHGRTSHLTPRQLDDLIEYILSL